MESYCINDLSVVEQDIYDVSRYFEAACIPGSWAPDPKTDQILSKFRSLIPDALDSSGFMQFLLKTCYSRYLRILSTKT